mgnify:CR=1 FL=1
MKEEDFLKTIKNIIGNDYIGDDCAYLKDLELVISQDSLVEGVHFSFNYMTPYQLGYKSGKVNISDIVASGGKSKYMLVSLSLPNQTDTKFVQEFYHGLKDAIGDVKIIGGDITGSDKVMISITIIGEDNNRKISSRKNAKTGYVIITNGVHGSSAGGLKLLQTGRNNEKLTTAHIMPNIDETVPKIIAENITTDYAMMDTSDGLADALFKIAKESNKTIVVDFNQIKYDKELKEYFPNDYKNMILYGGEDYKIVAAIPEDFAKKNKFNIIGYVEEKQKTPVIIKNYENEDIIVNSEEFFNHFK